MGHMISLIFPFQSTVDGISQTEKLFGPMLSVLFNLGNLKETRIGEA